MLKEEKRIKQLKDKLLKLGPMLPGSVSEQWNVCGTPGCKCKDIKNPVKHGPYYQLSFSVKGKSSSLFIKKENLSQAKRCMNRYKQFKELTMALTQAYIDLIRKIGFLKKGLENDRLQ